MNRIYSSLKIILPIAAGAAITFVATSMLSRCGHYDSAMPVTEPDTIVIHDTITIVAPPAASLTEMRHVAARLPLWKAPATRSIPALSATPHADSMDNSGPVTSDSATVTIPMQRKVYSDSLRYRAVVSGAFVNLDTMEIYTSEQQISFPTPRRQAPRRNWALAAGVGATMCRDGRIRPESSSESPIRSCNSELYNHPLCETYFCTNVKK